VVVVEDAATAEATAFLMAAAAAALCVGKLLNGTRGA